MPNLFLHRRLFLMKVGTVYAQGAILCTNCAELIAVAQE